MSVLFMVARGAENPEIVDLLLDTTKVTNKPNFDLAPPENLLLSDCGFEDLLPSDWTHDEGAYDSYANFRKQIEALTYN